MTANIRIGADFWELNKRGVNNPIIWSESNLSNPHVGVTGTTGAGKSHWIRKFCSEMPDDVEIDIFDVHGDLKIPGESEVLFSEHTRYGYNPLVINQDIHYGGLRRCVADVIDSINATSRKLGENQTGVLRNLLLDTFALRGARADIPASWAMREITEAESKALMASRDWKGLRNCYPHLSDVISLGKRKLKSLWLGVGDTGDGRAVMSGLEECSRALQSIDMANRRAVKMQTDMAAVEALQKRVAGLKKKAIDAFNHYVTAIETGREFEESIKYNSKDTLISVLNRLESLMEWGIYNPNPPPFKSTRRRYNLMPVSHSTDDLSMFVNFRLKAIIREAKEMGESSRIRRVVVLDECKHYYSEDPRSPVNVIATEMRKYGLMLLMAGQSPAHWSADFIRSAGTLLLLNLATADWGAARQKLMIDTDDLKFLKPQQTGAIRMLEKRKAATFRRVQF